MSVHPSLSSKSKGKRHRSVLKRYERLQELQEKERWKMGNSVFGLPKLKALRWKAKKAKKVAEEEAPPAAEAAPEVEAAEKKAEASEKK